MKKTLSDFYCLLFETLPRLNLRRPMIAILLVISSLNLQGRDTLNKEVTVTLTVNSASVKEILEMLEAQTSFRFFYNHKAMNNSPRITLSLHNVTFENALRELSTVADLVFKIRGNQIV